jgi:4-hydroxy-3-polyprenylbenzoate decarboxylase
VNESTFHLQQHPQRVIVGITGASGSIFGIRLLEVLRRYNAIETHLVITPAGKRTIIEETRYTIAEVEGLASRVHANSDIGAALASGSFRTLGMVVAPCSIKSASAIAYGYSDNLLSRAADVTLKEGRLLVALVRESPLHLGHLRMLTQFAEIGGVVLPPVPAFYNRPSSIDDLVNHTIARVLDRLHLPQSLIGEWTGTSRKAATPAPEDALKVPQVHDPL